MLLENQWSEASSDAELVARHRSHVSILAPQSCSNSIIRLSTLDRPLTTKLIRPPCQSRFHLRQILLGCAERRIETHRLAIGCHRPSCLSQLIQHDAP